MSLAILRLQQRKQNHVADRFGAGQQHREPIDPKPEAAGRRHAVLEREQKFFVELLRLFAGLFEQPLPLDRRIVQLGVTGRNLLAVDDQLVNVHERIVLRVLFGQRNQFLRAMRHEKRIERFLFDQLLENLLRDFVIGHPRIDLDAELGAALPAFLARVIEPLRIDLADQIAITRAPPRAREIDRARDVSFRVLVLDLDGRASAFRFPAVAVSEIVTAR